jgi:DNA polymerase III subunit epsilon
MMRLTTWNYHKGVSMSRQIVLDTETTGLSPAAGHRVIEIGCIEIKDRLVTQNSLHLYTNPDREIDAGAMRVHGITNEFVSDKPRFNKIVKEFLAFVEGAELIIHNAPFDVGFLNHELSLCGRQYGKLEDHCTITDTLVMARDKHPGQRNSLDALCQRYSVDNSSRDYHGALLDSKLLAQVYLYMTGGQKQLFAIDDEVGEDAVEDIKIRPVSSQRDALAVVDPDAEELAKHQAYLLALEKKGKCVWTQLNEGL